MGTRPVATKNTKENRKERQKYWQEINSAVKRKSNCHNKRTTNNMISSVNLVTILNDVLLSLVNTDGETVHTTFLKLVLLVLTINTY